MVAPTVAAELNEQHLRRLDQRLERFAGALNDPTLANREASIALYGFTVRNFDLDGGLQGGWAPLAPSTVRQKQRIGKEKMLVRRGQLRAGFTSFYSRDNAGVGNEQQHSAYHYHGTTTIPKRELLPNRENTLRIGLKVYGQYVEREARKANG